MKQVMGGIAAVAALMLAPTASADVKAGVDAWAQGDYARAIAAWRPLAEAGDADAQFNLGQAYKLGRGVPQDASIALEWFRRAAEQGHARAEDNYGLLLFQQGKRADAMPYISRAADRGEPRAQYILGTALFNGEYVGKDWVRAYAMMSRAAAANLGPAQASLSQMDRYVPADQRQQGLALAADMEKRQKEGLLAAAATPASPPPVKPTEQTAPVIRKTPGPIRETAVPPSTPPPSPAPAKAAPAGKAEAPAAPAPVPAPKVATTGAWRIQLGAFSEEKRAAALWTSLSAKLSALSPYQHYLVKDGGLTRLQAGPFATKAEADKLCGSVRSAGADCLTKKP